MADYFGNQLDIKLGPNQWCRRSFHFMWQNQSNLLAKSSKNLIIFDKKTCLWGPQSKYYMGVAIHVQYNVWHYWSSQAHCSHGITCMSVWGGDIMN